jgi:predicted transcriptional regulator
MNKAAILDEIRAYSEDAKVHAVPEGWLTFAEIEAALSCGHSKAQRVMAELVAGGRYERQDINWHGGKLALFRKVAPD